MTDLETTRDHAAAMAAMTEPARPTRRSWWCGTRHTDPCGAAPDQCGCTCHDPDRTPVPTDAERVLWRQIADEITAHIDGQADDEGQEALLP